MYTRVWKVTVDINGFRTVVMIQGTEEEMRAYIRSELHDAVKYVGASDEEVENYRTLGCSVYLAPTID